MSDIVERFLSIKNLVGIKRNEFCKRVGVSATTHDNYQKGKGTPKAPFLSKVCEEFCINGHWLLTGEGDVFTDESPAPSRPADPNILNTGENLNLIGLAQCGVDGWSQTMPIAINSSVPEFHKDYIAALTIGDSMVPAGVLPGNIVYCDPRLQPSIGEPVFVMRRDAHGEEAAGVKIYKGQDEKWLYLQGWLAKQGNKPQTEFNIQQLVNEISIIAPVVMIRRRV